MGWKGMGIEWSVGEMGFGITLVPGSVLRHRLPKATQKALLGALYLLQKQMEESCSNCFEDTLFIALYPILLLHRWHINVARI